MSPRYSLLMLALSPVLLTAKVFAADAASAKTLEAVEIKASEIKTSPQLKQQQVSAKDIDSQQISNLTDLVRMVPGVNLTDIGRFGSSGFNIRGVEGDRVKIAVDGLALGETMDPDSHAPYEFFRSGLGGIDPDALKQVNILKGADAISAGSGALGGAVLFLTKDPADFLNSSGDDGALKFKSQYSGNNSEWLHSITGAARTGRLESLLVYSSRDGEESQSYDRHSTVTGPGSTSADPLSAQSRNLLLKLQYSLLPEHKIGYSLDSYQTDSSLQNLSRQDQTYLSRTGLDDSNRDKHSLQYDYLAGLALFDTLQLKFDHQNSRNHGLTRMTVTATCPQNVSPCIREEDRDFRQKLTQWTAAFDKELNTEKLLQQWTYGLQAQNKTVSSVAIDRRFVGQTSTLATTEVDPAFVPVTDISTRSIYARNLLSLTDTAWSFGLGARYDSIDYNPQLSATYQDKTGSVKAVDFGAASYQAQLHYQLDERQRLSLQAGRGFRAPTTEDMYLQTSTTSLQEAVSGNTVTLPTAQANPALKPEHSLNLELSYQLTLDNSAHQLSLFRDKYSDMIQSGQFTINPTTVYQSCVRGVCSKQNGAVYSMPVNIDSAVVKGIELEGHWQPDAHWRLNWAATYQSGEEQNGEPLLSVMPWSAVLGVGYQLNDDIRLLLNNRYQAAKSSSDAWVYNSSGAQTAATPYLSDSAFVSDLSLQWQVLDQLALTAGVFNLLDQEYYRWERLQYVTQSVGAVRGGVSGDGIRRYLESGRYGKVSLTLSF
ncbi:TonB-dependent hemoglobin/transferrin/lactoferrin family receptor [Rheinheimera texasensis]|uniref:TonB-dependent hemoglobin/transferrin/lactoferrin family receptor n=1 Tax=Rheinheimera texasensis TaxID=306205 RepID=UPI0004E27693|nr:TonB-dependent hemoglobin/transferrin/lactoferrin family receptor [Rheinheimera texasensis]